LNPATTVMNGTRFRCRKKQKGGPLMRAAFRDDENQWLQVEAVIQP